MYVMYPACFLKEENGYNVIKETAPSPNKSLLGTNKFAKK